MRTKSLLLLLTLPLILLACSLRWSTSATEDVMLGNGSVIKITRTTHFRQAGSDRNLGFGQGGQAREWSISFASPDKPDRDVTWEAEDRIPILLDTDVKTGRFFIVGMKPFSNGTSGDNHWPSGNQNPYYVYELDGKAWKEVEFRPDLIGRRNNLFVRFEHFYVERPTPTDIGHLSLQEKTRLELAQDAKMRGREDYKYKLRYRVIGDHLGQTKPFQNTAPAPVLPDADHR